MTQHGFRRTRVREHQRSNAPRVREHEREIAPDPRERHARPSHALPDFEAQAQLEKYADVYEHAYEHALDDGLPPDQAEADASQAVRDEMAAARAAGEAQRISADDAISHAQNTRDVHLQEYDRLAMQRHGR